MKTKTVFLSLALFVSTLAVNAQVTWTFPNFTYSCADTNITCQLNGTDTLTCTIQNKTVCCGAAKIVQSIDSIINLPSGWYLTMCNPNGCKSPSVVRDTFYSYSASTISASFVIHANNNPGNIDIAVSFYNIAFPTSSIAFHIAGSSSPAGIAPVETTDNSPLAQNFPNPFSTYTTIKYNTGHPNGRLVIRDMQGKTVDEYNLNSVSGELIIPTENLNSGIYFYSLYTGDKIVATKKMSVN